MAKALVTEELSDTNSELDNDETSNMEPPSFPSSNASVSGIGKDTLKKLGLDFLSDDDYLSGSEKDGSDTVDSCMKDFDALMAGLSLGKKRFRRTISEKNMDMFKGEIKEIFDILDVDGVGKIRTKEVSFAMQALGYDPEREEVKEIKSKLDPQKTGMVSYEDFSTLLIYKMTTNDPQVRTKEDAKGASEKQKVPSNFEDFKNFAKEWGEYWTDDEIRVMVEEDNNTEISLEDFKKFMSERSSS